jgi:hypothetical protein
MSNSTVQDVGCKIYRKILISVCCALISNCANAATPVRNISNTLSFEEMRMADGVELKNVVKNS